jgi:hypothetical protein
VTTVQTLDMKAQHLAALKALSVSSHVKPVPMLQGYDNGVRDLGYNSENTNNINDLSVSS